MSAASRRLGIRQWVACCELARMYPLPVATVHILRAVTAASPGIANYNFLRTMEASGLVRHACVMGQHQLGRGCLVEITEKGLDARPGPATSTWLRERRFSPAT